MPFGVQSSSDKKDMSLVLVSPDASPLPFGVQSSSDQKMVGVLWRKRHVSIAFRRSVPIGQVILAHRTLEAFDVSIAFRRRGLCNRSFLTGSYGDCKAPICKHADCVPSLRPLSAFSPHRTGMTIQAQTYTTNVVSPLPFGVKSSSDDGASHGLYDHRTLRLHCLSAFSPHRTLIIVQYGIDRSNGSPLPFGVQSSSD